MRDAPPAGLADAAESVCAMDSDGRRKTTRGVELSGPAAVAGVGGVAAVDVTGWWTGEAEVPAVFGTGLSTLSPRNFRG